MSVMAKEPRVSKKSGAGRPQADVETVVVSGRVHPDFRAALNKMRLHNRRSISAEIGVAIEDRLLDQEELLRRLGVWTPEMDRLKEERKIAAPIDDE